MIELYQYVNIPYKLNLGIGYDYTKKSTIFKNIQRDKDALIFCLS